MRHQALVYKQKVADNLSECRKHLLRLCNAFLELEKYYLFPIQKTALADILADNYKLAFCDQIIYRFSKLQDCMGAKLFKSVLLYEGENINKPFLDILNRLEAINIVNVDQWFELRDLRNEIAHDYEDNEENALNIVNAIFKLQNELEVILKAIDVLINKKATNE